MSEFFHDLPDGSKFFQALSEADGFIARAESGDRVQELQAALADLKAERDNLFPFLVEAEKKNARYAHEIGLLVQENESLRGQVESMTAELEDVSERLESARDQVCELTIRAQELEDGE